MKNDEFLEKLAQNKKACPKCGRELFAYISKYAYTPSGEAVLRPEKDWVSYHCFDCHAVFTSTEAESFAAFVEDIVAGMIRNKAKDPHHIDMWAKRDETLGEGGIRFAVVFDKPDETLEAQVAVNQREGYVPVTVVADDLLRDLYEYIDTINNAEMGSLQRRILEAVRRTGLGEKRE